MKDIACRFLDQEAEVMGGLAVRESIGLATLVPGPLLLLVIVIGVIVIGPRSVTVIGCLLQIILQAAMKKSTRKKSALDSFGSFYSPEALLN